MATFLHNGKSFTSAKEVYENALYWEAMRESYEHDEKLHRQRCAELGLDPDKTDHQYSELLMEQLNGFY